MTDPQNIDVRWFQLRDTTWSARVLFSVGDREISEVVHTCETMRSTAMRVAVSRIDNVIREALLAAEAA